MVSKEYTDALLEYAINNKIPLENVWDMYLDGYYDDDVDDDDEND